MLDCWEELKYVDIFSWRHQIKSIAFSRAEVLHRENQATVFLHVPKISEEVGEIGIALFVNYVLVKLLPLADLSNPFNEAR